MAKIVSFLHIAFLRSNTVVSGTVIQTGAHHSQSMSAVYGEGVSPAVDLNDAQCSCEGLPYVRCLKCSRSSLGRDDAPMGPGNASPTEYEVEDLRSSQYALRGPTGGAPTDRVPQHGATAAAPMGGASVSVAALNSLSSRVWALEQLVRDMHLTLALWMKANTKRGSG